MKYSREEHSKVFSEWQHLVIIMRLPLDDSRVIEVEKKLRKIERSMKK